MGTNLSNLIKHIDSKVHDDYILERYKEGHTSTGRGGHVENPKFDIPKPVFNQKGIFNDVKSFREIGKQIILLIGSLKTEEFLMITISIWSISFILGLIT